MARAPGPQSFFWSELDELLEANDADNAGELDPRRDSLIVGRARIHPPAVLPIPADAVDIDDYRASLPDALGLHLVVLAQAGAAALGLFENAEPLATKTFRRYVVRGKGRAQPTHLRSKGKSRYGSRLRLRNASDLIDDVHERLRSWLDLYGEPERLFYSCPVRLWSEILAPGRHPALPKNAGWIRIPRDLPVPSTEILLRTYRGLCYGRIEIG